MNLVLKKHNQKLSNCVVEKINSFAIVRVENERSVRKKSYPINTIFRPVKN